MSTITDRAVRKSFQTFAYKGE